MGSDTKTDLYKAVSMAFTNGKFDRHSYGISTRSIEDATGIKMEELSEDERKYAEELAKHFSERIRERLVNKASEAAKVLYDMVNGGDKAIVRDALVAHRYLMNELAWAMMESISKHARHNETEFDGRISVAFQDFIKEFIIYPPRQ